MTIGIIVHDGGLVEVRSDSEADVIVFEHPAYAFAGDAARDEMERDRARIRQLPYAVKSF